MTTASLAHQSTPDLNTLPDPRSPSPPTNTVSRTPSNSSTPHPDLSEEVAALSTKLINAINHQTNLDDELQGTKHELEVARERVRVLEAREKEHQGMLESGIFVKKADSERKEEDLRFAIDEERRARNSAEREKRGMEQQLEDLTSSLFEEANTMVSKARIETEASEKRAEQINSKLKDTETLLASHQEQLRDLKAVLSQVQTEQQITDAASTAPTTPIKESFARASRDSTRGGHSARQSTASNIIVVPEPPLKYSHLLQPVLRTDLQAYEDFLSLLKISNSTSPPSRNTSGNFSGLNVMGLGFKPSDSSQSTVVPSQHQKNNSNSSQQNSSANSTPNLSSGNFNTASPSENTQNLKDTKFYKRVLVEDIEPLLRLESAPGLSFFARRSVLSSMLAGNLIVEPYAPRKLYLSPAYSCTMCGEIRVSEEHGRRHRFRIHDGEDAQQYPLCDYCLQRLRAACDFIGFLRGCKAGLWKGSGSGNVDIEGKAAWEESVRQRERMLWARIGGGVVPATGGHHEVSSPGMSPTETRDSMRLNGIAPSPLSTKVDTEVAPKSRSRERSATVIAATDVYSPTSADEDIPPPLKTDYPQLGLTQPTPADVAPPLSATSLSMPLSAYNRASSSSTSVPTVKSASGATSHVLTQARTESPGVSPNPITRARTGSPGPMSAPISSTPMTLPSAGSSAAPQKVNRVAALASRFQHAAAASSSSSSPPPLATRRRQSQASVSSLPSSPERRSPERRSPERPSSSAQPSHPIH